MKMTTDMIGSASDALEALDVLATLEGMVTRYREAVRVASCEREEDEAYRAECLARRAASRLRHAIDGYLLKSC